MTEGQLDLLFKRAHEQHKTPSLKTIEEFPTSGTIIVWDRTPEGWKYWNDILSKANEYKSRYNL